MRVLVAAGLFAALPILSACGSWQLPSLGLSSEPAGPAVLPSSIPADQLVGNWGLAAYHQEAQRARTETMARAGCKQPYRIAKGQTGGVMMHLADAAELYELRLKGGPDGKNYLGPEGAINPDYDREIVSYDGKTMVMRWLDPEVAKRYGTMIYVRCA
jgi:hypothetical protein